MTSPFICSIWLMLAGLPEPASGGSFTVADGVSILPLSEVHAGQKGIGRTVFSGGRLEEFSVEVLGVVQNSAPRRSTIYARLTGGPLAETNIIAGMSGSPVWIDGRLVGAVASTYAFSKAPIAGITPIEDMLAIPERALSVPGEKPLWLAAPGGIENSLGRVAGIERGDFPSSFERARPLLEHASSAGHLSVPLAFAGFGAAASARAAQWFGNSSFSVVQAGLASSTAGSGAGAGAGGARSASNLQPGAPIAVQLLRGDFQVAAIGTVTARDGDRVLAFGHPLFGAGTVSLPIATAEIVAVIPSVLNSFKIASIGEAVGALEQDRTSGVLGRIDGHAKMVPVRLRIKRGAGELYDYSFEAATHRLLTPLLLDLALDGAFQSAEKDAGAATVELSGRIGIEGHPDIVIDQFLSGDSAPGAAAKFVAALAAVVLDNEFEAAAISGISLSFDYREDNRLAVIDRVWTDRVRVKPGETVEVKVQLRQARGGEQLVRLNVAVPAEAAPGPLELAIGDAGAMARFEARTQRSAPRTLDQVIELVNRLRKSSHVYALLTRPDVGIAVGGERLSSLPPSAYALISGGAGADSLTPLKRVTLNEREAKTDFLVSGLKTMRLTVEGARK